MIRTEIIYDGRNYTLAGTDVDDFKARILRAHHTGEAFRWTVNSGEGTYRPPRSSLAQVSQ